MVAGAGAGAVTCGGFVCTPATAAGAIATAERALVIGAETCSATLHPDDRIDSAILGNGAGAVVLRAGDATEPGGSRHQTGPEAGLAPARPDRRLPHTEWPALTTRNFTN
ncbi:hypothetical protein [Streptomyces chengmaiensis]|uniref:hypothetical protein n=1 Tax=Streptomyces chengmaiensis TaxID=3040919 RepID=UPI002962397F|nr:hypothetical protein [Streptomyces chengmaiensis]